MGRDHERDPDDWFAGADDTEWPPAPRAAVTETDALPPPGAPPDDWLDDDEDGARAATLPWSTGTKLGVAAVLLVILLVLGLLLGGVFDSESTPSTTPTATPVTTTQQQVTTQSTPTTTAATTTVPVPTAQLAFGDKGTEVEQLQRALAAAGYQVGTIDGDYGPATKAAVQELQQDEGLKVDGIAGPETLDALRAKVAGA
jgi:hypothetical protein